MIIEYTNLEFVIEPLYLSWEKINFNLIWNISVYDQIYKHIWDQERRTGDRLKFNFYLPNFK